MLLLTPSPLISINLAFIASPQRLLLLRETEMTVMGYSLLFFLDYLNGNYVHNFVVIIFDYVGLGFFLSPDSSASAVVAPFMVIGRPLIEFIR